MLAKAQKVEDLILKSERRDLLWRTLKERAEKDKTYQAGHSDPLEIDPEILAFLGGFGSLMEKKSNYFD